MGFVGVGKLGLTAVHVALAGPGYLLHGPAKATRGSPPHLYLCPPTAHLPPNGPLLAGLPHTTSPTDQEPVVTTQPLWDGLSLFDTHTHSPTPHLLPAVGLAGLMFEWERNSKEPVTPGKRMGSVQSRVPRTKTIR